MMDILLGIVAFAVVILVLSTTVMGAKAVLLPSHPVSISIAGGETVRDQTGRTLFTALTDAGIDLPGNCGGKGTCGLCRVTVRAGAGDPASAELARLSRAELRDGLRLSCQITLRDDVAIELPPSLLNAVSCTATVESCRTIAPFIKEIVLRLPEGCGLMPEPGAFVEVTAPRYRLAFEEIDVAPEHRGDWQRLGVDRLSAGSARSVTRAYSVANRPTDTGRIVLNIRLALPPPGTDAPPGVVSSWLFGLSSGDTVAVRGPFGNFRAQPTENEMVFIGGGVGMAPLRAIVTDQLERVGTRRRIGFWYGARSGIDMIYHDEFETLAARHGNFDWTVVLSDPRPEDDWHGPVGLVHEVVYEQYLKRHPAPETCEYYLCGPPLMLRAVRAMLDELGVEFESVYFDDFGS